MIMAVQQGSSVFARVLVWLGLAIAMLWAAVFGAVTVAGETQARELVLAAWQLWVCGGLALAGFGWFMIALAKRRM